MSSLFSHLLFMLAMHSDKCTCHHLFPYGQSQICFPLFFAAKIHLITSMNFDNKGLVTWRNFSPGWDFSPAVDVLKGGV